ncbi:MAG: hypothetical protein JNJ77_14260 [Planctomycetia bacterium]|nr:hypothetical protein [Planctomycetia bacterium]
MGISWNGPSAFGMTYRSFHALQTSIARAGVLDSGAASTMTPTQLLDLYECVRRLERQDPIRWFVTQGEDGALELGQCEVLSRRLTPVLDKLLQGSVSDDCLDGLDWFLRELVEAVRLKQRITWG